MSDPKKVKLIRIGDLEPECPKCTGSNAMLHECKTFVDPDWQTIFFHYLTCRDCDFSVLEKDIEIEKITMAEGQERLRKYGSLFPY